MVNLLGPAYGRQPIKFILSAFVSYLEGKRGEIGPMYRVIRVVAFRGIKQARLQAYARYASAYLHIFKAYVFRNHYMTSRS